MESSANKKPPPVLFNGLLETAEHLWRVRDAVHSLPDSSEDSRGQVVAGGGAQNATSGAHDPLDTHPWPGTPLHLRATQPPEFAAKVHS